MYKNIIRISLTAAVLLVIFTLSANTFAAETAHRTGYGHYSLVPVHAPYHHGAYYGGYDYHHGHSRYQDHYHHGHYPVPQPIIVAPPSGIYLRTPRAAIGIYF